MININHGVFETKIGFFFSFLFDVSLLYVISARELCVDLLRAE